MKLGEFWSRAWSAANSVSIRAKIMGIVLILILILGLGITLQVRSSLTVSLADRLERQGIAVAKHLAAHSTNLILTGNFYDLYQSLRDIVESDDAVRYAFVLDSDGNIITHSFSGGFPVGLAEVNQLEADAELHLERLDTDEGLILDMAVPVFGGRAGVARVGMSTHFLDEMIAAITRRWLIVTGVISVLGLLAAYFLTSVLTRPIVHLVEVTKAITRGDLKRKAPVWAQDEIGRLGIAFNAMTEYLAKSHSESEAFQAEVIKRNLELAALNTIATELSGSRDLVGIMRRSLAKIIEFMDFNAGWVSTLAEDGKHTMVICHTGLSRETVRKLANVNTASCTCQTAIHEKTPVVISGAEEKCPVLNHKLDNGQPLVCHAAVPLISKSRVFGLLHIASSELGRFTEDNLRLLDALGRQMGVAIENARLWDELKRREEVRRQLLEGTISAQEAERKRIARELHDQTGQSLTSLIVGLKVLETEDSKVTQQRIADMRQLAAETLDGVHDLALELRPSALDDLGLITTLEQYVREYTDKFGINTEFQAIGFEGRRLLPEVEIILYRIVQEALTNVVKHAAANKVSVLMEIRGPSIVAIVEDNGKGFDVQKESTSATNKQKLGLYGMYERAELIDGTLTIESRIGKGTTVFVEVPLKGNESQ